MPPKEKQVEKLEKALISAHNAQEEPGLTPGWEKKVMERIITPDATPYEGKGPEIGDIALKASAAIFGVMVIIYLFHLFSAPENDATLFKTLLSNLINGGFPR